MKQSLTNSFDNKKLRPVKSKKSPRRFRTENLTSTLVSPRSPSMQCWKQAQATWTPTLKFGGWGLARGEYLYLQRAFMSYTLGVGTLVKCAGAVFLPLPVPGLRCYIATQDMKNDRYAHTRPRQRQLSYIHMQANTISIHTYTHMCTQGPTHTWSACHICAHMLHVNVFVYIYMYNTYVVDVPDVGIF